MSTATMNPRDFRAYPKAVVDVLKEAINEHGVAYRDLDGGHIRLYSGNRDVVPLKVASSRPAEYTLPYLHAWLEENIPSWRDRNKPKPKPVVAALEDAVANKAATQKAAPKASAPAKAEAEGDAGAKYGLKIVGDDYVCLEEGCGWSRPVSKGNNGLHLHYLQKHSGRGEEIRAAGRATEQVNKDQRLILRREAVRVLAQQNGLDVVEKGQGGGKEIARLTKEIARLIKDNERLQAQVEKLTAERDELKARLDLMRDALKA